MRFDIVEMLLHFVVVKDGTVRSDVAVGGRSIEHPKLVLELDVVEYKDSWLIDALNTIFLYIYMSASTDHRHVVALACRVFDIRSRSLLVLVVLPVFIWTPPPRFIYLTWRHAPSFRANINQRRPNHWLPPTFQLNKQQATSVTLFSILFGVKSPVEVRGIQRVVLDRVRAGLGITAELPLATISDNSNN